MQEIVGVTFVCVLAFIAGIHLGRYLEEKHYSARGTHILYACSGEDKYSCELRYRTNSLEECEGAKLGLQTMKGVNSGDVGFCVPEKAFK